MLVLIGVAYAAAGWADPPVRVRTAKLAEIALYPERSAPATVLSLNEARFSAEVAARIVEIPVRVGEVVERDAVLARLDCRDFELQLRATDARALALGKRIGLAERRLERTRKLTMQHSVSEEVLDERDSELAVLNAEREGLGAEIDKARLQVSRCRITTPFRAVVTDRIAAEGQYVAIGDPVVAVLDSDRLEVSAQVYSGDIDQVAIVEELFFVTHGSYLPVKIRLVVPAVDPETRNREVRLEFTDRGALPGTAGKLVWRDARAHIPGTLLVRREGELGIFVADRGVARFVVLPNAQAGRASPADLAPTTPLVIEGHYALRNETAIEEIN